MAEEIIKEVSTGISHLFNDAPTSTSTKKDDAVHPYTSISKSTVLQTSRTLFHDSTLVHASPSQCATTLTQLLHLQNSNDFTMHLQRVEATEVFFGVTKLFVSNDSMLRRMVYVFLKDVVRSCDPSDVIIVTSCLTKDMTCDVDLYRANALRVLVHIIDEGMLSAIERYVKQAILHKSPIVSSSALVSSMHLFQKSPESAGIVKRWIGEVMDALKSENYMVQFHATQLFYMIKCHDRLGVSKFVQKYAAAGGGYSSNGSDGRNSNYNANNGSRHGNNNGTSNKNQSLQSPMAIICLIRYTSKLLHDEILSGRIDTTKSISSSPSQILTMGYKYLESSLRHESEMVSYEAARAISSLPTHHPEDIHPALSVLQLLLSSPKPSARMGAVKTLGQLAQNHPRLVSKFNEDLEALLGDSNRLIGTLAITTLLQTGNEESIDRLLKCIYTFLAYIAEEYKIMVVGSLRRLCVLYPKKYVAVVAFMTKFLREEGGYPFKRTIVSSMEEIMSSIPESTELVLIHLCEFIEDCEFLSLSTWILHMLGDLGPRTQRPARYVRFVYNRTILDGAAVRAAAVSALGKFGAVCPELRVSVVELLRRCEMDMDDETRDRAVVALKFLEVAEEERPYRKPDDDDDGEVEDSVANTDESEYHLYTKLPFTFDNLERRLQEYKSRPEEMQSDQMISLDTLPVVAEIAPVVESELQSHSTDTMGIPSSSPLHAPAQKLMTDQSSILNSIPEFASFGQIYHSTPPISLTENEAEYVVRCLKHVYSEHVVLQFMTENTIEDQRLKDVSVSVDCDHSEVFECTGELPSECISYGQSASCFTVLERRTDIPMTTDVFGCELKFTMVQVDPQTGEEEGEEFVDEEYALEDVELSIFDFVVGDPVKDFRKGWEGLAGKCEILQKYCLPQKNIDEAVSALVGCVGLKTMDGTAKVRQNAKQHMLHLAGTCLGKTVVARAQISRSSAGAMILKLALRSEDSTLCQAIADSIG